MKIFNNLAFRNFFLFKVLGCEQEFEELFETRLSVAQRALVNASINKKSNSKIASQYEAHAMWALDNAVNMKGKKETIRFVEECIKKGRRGAHLLLAKLKTL
ncbi:MAG: hypothetical protein HY094_04495 [Candidatus Melainabacteria bacterium]|nr:hypothetical protein [Candidatus Melainabacteria bacterium]